MLCAGLHEACSELVALEVKLAEIHMEMQRYMEVLSPLADKVDGWTLAKRKLDEMDEKDAKVKRLSAFLPHLRLRERRTEQARCSEVLGKTLEKLKEERAAEETAAKQLAALGSRRTAEQMAQQQEELQAILDELQSLDDKHQSLQNDARRLEREKTGKEDAWRDEEKIQQKVEERLRLAQQVNLTRP